jgi:tetratricopeptide (TPR) repeat protein
MKGAMRSVLHALVVLACALAFPGHAQQAKQSQSLDPAVAKDLLVAYEKLEAEKHREALADLNRLMERRGESMKPFDRASVLQVRGTVYVNLENYAAALRDFEEVLRVNALPPEQNLQMRFNVAQLYFLSEKYPEAIRNFNEWIKQAENPSANAYSMLAAAYYYTKDYRNARGAIEQAIRRSTEPERRYYDLANAIYSELGLARERTLLLERMIALWPKEQSYWRQLAALYVEQNRQQESFVTLETAYLNGLIDSESDLVSLSQFYSLFNNPHRGAKLLEKEMTAKRVERNVKNLELLSQLWSQAREHKKAIPVLQEAARISDTGMLSFRLGQALLADEQHAEAQKAFEAALRKGGLTGTTEQEAWLLLGTARFNQAGPGDRDRRRSADEAFTQAERFAGTRNRATEWRRYIKAIDDTESRQAALEREQQERLEAAAEERLKTACRAQQLARADLSDECKAVLEAEEETPAE